MSDVSRDGEKILVRVPPQLWEWIDSKPWHESEWEMFKDAKLPKATKVCRALLLLYNWFKHLPRYVSRKGATVTIRFETEGHAQVFCAMLSKEEGR